MRSCPTPEAAAQIRKNRSAAGRAAWARSRALGFFRRRTERNLRAKPFAVRVRKCRRCGCTDNDCSGCIARTGFPCSWAAKLKDVCTACLTLNDVVGATPA